MQNKPHVQHTQPEEEEFFHPQVGEKSTSSEKHYSFLHLLKTSNIRIISGVVCLTWWVSIHSASRSPFLLRLKTDTWSDHVIKSLFQSDLYVSCDSPLSFCPLDIFTLLTCYSCCCCFFICTPSVSPQVDSEHRLLWPVTECVPVASQPLHQQLPVRSSRDPGVHHYLGGAALLKTKGLPPHHPAPGCSVTALHPAGAQRYSLQRDFWY